jgi:hypothetical protein
VFFPRPEGEGPGSAGRVRAVTHTLSSLTTLYRDCFVN